MKNNKQNVIFRVVQTLFFRSEIDDLFLFVCCWFYKNTVYNVFKKNAPLPEINIRLF